MPMKRERYAPDWEATSARVREAAGQRCEWCGKPNGERVRTIPALPGVWWDRATPIYPPGCVKGQWLDRTGLHEPRVIGETPPRDAAGNEYATKTIRVVLTVAHLDQDPRNDRPGNLAALCQACHLRHDAPHNRAKASETRRRQREARKA